METQSCTLGADIGTTAVKVLAFDDTGREIARASQALELKHDSAGAAEQDPRAVYDALVSALVATTKQVRDAGYAIARMGLSTAMHSLIPISRSGEPLMPAMTWADLRAQQAAEELWKRPEGKAVYARTGTPIHPMAPLAKLIWLREERPDIFKAAARFVSLKEWFWYQWFGEWKVDASIASATGLYNLREDTWDAEALRLAGIEASRLSELVPTTYVRTGVRDARLVAAGMSAETVFNIGASDGVLANLGVGAIGAGEMVLTIGTSMAVRVGSVMPVTDADTRSFCYVLDRNRYILGGPSNNGGIVLDWLYHKVLDTQHGADPAHATPASLHLEKDDGFTALIGAAGEARAEGLLFLPYISGERAPLWNGNATGVMLGLRVRHTAADIMRAAIEGILFNAYWIASRLFQQSGKPRVVVASGGVLEEEWIRELTADIFDLPVMQVGSSVEASAMGAALLAKIATGASTWDEAMKLHESTSQVKPRATAHAAYQEQFDRFSRLAQALTGDLADLYLQAPEERNRE